CWTPLEDSTLAHRCIAWHHTDNSTLASLTPTIRPLAIQDEAGIFLEVHCSSEAAQVIMHLHHCCSDGIGGLQLMGELFGRYGQKTAEVAARRPEIDSYLPSQLRFREDYDVGDGATRRQKRSLGRILGKVSRLMFRTPVAIGAVKTVHAANPTALNPPAMIQSRILPRPLYRSLRAAAAVKGVSLNDLVLCDMILHIRDWNRRAGVSMQRRWIRLAVPLSMRSAKHVGMPCSNIVSYALVTRSEAECRDEMHLLKSIHQQTNDVLFNREGIVCLKIFRVLRRIPGAMKMFLQSKSVFSTMVLANVGDIRKRAGGRFPLDQGRWVAGNVIVSQIHGVAPIRPNTRAAMSIGDYAGSLSISLRTDSKVFTKAEANEFFDQFLSRLHAHISTANVTSSADERHDEPT
ncbi:MAG: hypothetical protein ACK58L_14335, partial [Planctomycetota bacterium]